MTFWPAHKAMRSIAAGQNVAEKNPTKGAARLGFFGARAAEGGEAYTDLLCDVPAFQLIYEIFIEYQIYILNQLYIHNLILYLSIFYLIFH
ncbi:hypothetical protein PilKf_00372 [Pillotina sp. SPG140]